MLPFQEVLEGKGNVSRFLNVTDKNEVWYNQQMNASAVITLTAFF